MLGRAAGCGGRCRSSGGGYGSSGGGIVPGMELLLQRRTTTFCSKQVHKTAPKIFFLIAMLKRCLSLSHHNPWNSLVCVTSTNGYVVKDNIASGKTTSGSGILSNYVSPFDATVVELLASAGYSVKGKANLDEFGMGSGNTNSYFGAVKNPLFEGDFISGGSSGGSAAAVAAGECDFALGTDTGGSVRLPAAHCGVYGFKPSYGRVSRWGIVAYAQSLDTVGILGNSIDTVKEVFRIVDKYDSKDPTSMLKEKREEMAVNLGPRPPKKYVIGVPQEFIVGELCSEYRDAVMDAVVALMDQGHEVRTVSVPSIKKLALAYYAIATAEAASNLARYDGIRYGPSAGASLGSNDLLSARTQGLGPEVQRRILLGNYTLSNRSGDHYHKAIIHRNTVTQEFNHIFNHCDIILGPLTVEKPPSIDEFTHHKNPMAAFYNDIFTVPASLAGLPALSVPAKTKSRTGGIQITGPYGSDAALLNFASVLQS